MNKKPLVSIVISTKNRKEDAIRCLKSLRNLEYPEYEVIVNDNASTDGTAAEIEQKFPEVVLVKGDQDLGPAGGRNVGIKHANGDFIFFLDCDNVVDKDVLTELIDVISKDETIGIVGPKMYHYGHPKRIWSDGGEINLITSRTTFIGNKVDGGRFDEIREVGHFPNAFLVRRHVIDKVGFFDENYFFLLEESDFCHRAKRAGFKILFVPSAKVWHGSASLKDISILKRLGINTEQRAYFTARNRLLFMRKNANFIGYLIFIIIFFPLFSFYFIAILSLHKRKDLIVSYLKGAYDGLFNKRFRKLGEV